jgi:hypothetical protein
MCYVNWLAHNKRPGKKTVDSWLVVSSVTG